MKQQLVTLKITYDDEVTMEPATWDWSMLLDISDGGEVEVVSAEDVDRRKNNS